MVKFRRIYDTTIKKFLLTLAAVGVPIGIGLIMILAGRGDITILDHSGDDYCAGTDDDPCIAWVKFKANTDIFVYPMNDSNMLFGTDKKLKNLKVFRTWGKGLREYKINQSCTGTWCGLSNKDDVRKFAWAWREGKEYTVYFHGYKVNPKDVVKWSFTKALDPTWFGIENKKDSKISYKTICENVVVGTRAVYETVKKNSTIESCSDPPINKTCSSKISFYNVTVIGHYEDIIECKTVGLNINGKVIDFDIKGCEVCGDSLVCWSKKDGWSENRGEEFRCICRSGESCYIKNLTSSKIVYSRSDMGDLK